MRRDLMLEARRCQCRFSPGPITQNQRPKSPFAGALGLCLPGPEGPGGLYPVLHSDISFSDISFFDISSSDTFSNIAAQAAAFFSRA